MFEEQDKNSQPKNPGEKVEDIFADTDKSSNKFIPGSQEDSNQSGQQPSQTAGSIQQHAGIGPPSALSGGKLHPSNNSQVQSVSHNQMSGVKKSLPIAKILIVLVAVVVIGGGGFALYLSLRGGDNTGQVPQTNTDNQNQEDEVNEDGSTLRDRIERDVLDPFEQSNGQDNNPSQQDSGTGVVSAPEDNDADQDGLTNAQENEAGTNPGLFDSDFDNLSDWEEVVVFGTDPLNPDTDGDTYLDGEEVQNGYNPKGEGTLFDFENARENLAN